MSVVRRWVFPLVWVVIVAAGAGALVKLAFFPDTTAAVNPASPTGQVVEPHVAVARGTITNDVTISGTVSADPAIPVKATAVGTVDEFFTSVGQPVSQGDPIYDIRVETPRDPVQSVGDDGLPVTTQPKPSISFTKVRAPANGVLSSLDVVHGQSVAVGASTGQVAPPTFSVSGSLEPTQQYRLLTQPTEASIAVVSGPAPFTCTGLTISIPRAGADAAAPAASADASGSAPAGGSAGGSSGGGSAATVSCPVPAGITVFSGLAAKMTLVGGTSANALVVPVTAVQGSAQTGVVWLVGADGTTSQHAVTLGLNDGTQVEITGGLNEGDTIAQFVPGAASDATTGGGPSPAPSDAPSPGATP